MIGPGDASRPRTPAGGVEADEWIADRLEASVRGDPRIRGNYLEIQVQNRVVIFLGELDSSEAITAVCRLAWSTPGVIDVCDQVTVIS